MNKIWIYALLDPRNNEIRYIGKSKDPQKRFKQHIYTSSKENTRKGNWIKSLIKKDLKPILKILKETDEDEFNFWEEFYIKKTIDEGSKLTNYDEKGIGTSGGMKKRTVDKIKKKLSKKVYQYSLDGALIKEHASLREAERDTNINHGNISKCCKNVYPHVGGFIFSLEKKDSLPAIKNNKAEKKKVIEVDYKGDILEEYASIAEAARKTGIDASNISRVCSGKKKDTYNRKFLFKEE